MDREDSLSRREYWRHFRDNVNPLHPSCRDVSVPMETEETRTVTYRGERGAPVEHRERAQGARRDRDRRRGYRRRGTG